MARIRASARQGRIEDDKFFLTHAYPERWGTRRTKTEISGPEGKPIEHKVETELFAELGLTANDIAGIVDLINAAAAEGDTDSGPPADAGGEAAD